jgi:2-dehydropantoate 2-reductase
MKFNKTFVLGAGAIGSIFGALLSGKNDVTIIGNEAHMHAVGLNGLTISGEMEGNFHLKAKTEITDVLEETLIILTTKAYDSEDAVERIVKLLRRDTVILVLQNGLGNEEIVKHAVQNRAKVLRGITSMAAEFFNPGKVRFWGGKTIIEQDLAAESIVTMFKASGLDAETRENFKAELWKKLIANCVINPLTAIFQVRNCEILADSLLNVRHQIMREAVAVGKTEGLAFPAGFEKQVDKEITFYSNFSSMCQDIMKKRRTEIDFLNGKIVELGRKSNVPTPVNETLVHFVKFLEEKNELSREDQTEKR